MDEFGNEYSYPYFHLYLILILDAVSSDWGVAARTWSWTFACIHEV